MPIDLFADSSDEIEVKIVLAPSKTSAKRIYADIDEAKLKEIGTDDIDPATIEHHSFFFRSPSFGDSNKILDASVRMDQTGMQISPSELRYERLATLIIRWTLKDKDGKDLKPTRENIRNLNLVVAVVISADLEYQLQQRGLL